MPGEIPGFQTPQQQVAMPLNEPRLKSDGKSDGKDVGRRTEMSYKAESPGKTAQHVKAQGLRRLHDRLSDHKNEGLNEAKNAAAHTIDLHAVGEAMEDEIVPMELELYKPQEVADVLESLKDGGKQFEVFYDIEGKMRVLFKRNDGKFGLY